MLTFLNGKYIDDPAQTFVAVLLARAVLGPEKRSQLIPGSMASSKGCKKQWQPALV
jgi:hypothetical protein